MLDTLFALRKLSEYAELIPLNTRTRLAAEMIRAHRKETPHTIDFDSLFKYLKVKVDDVAQVYRELYGHPLFLNYASPLQEDEANSYMDSSATGVTNALLYYLRSKGIIELRRVDRKLLVNRDDWVQYKNRGNGYVSLAKAADILYVSRPFIRRVINEGLLTASKIQTGKTYHYQIPVDDLEVLRPKVEWVNLAEAGRRLDNRTREDIRLIVNRSQGKKGIQIKTRRIRPHERLIRPISVEQRLLKMRRHN